MPIRTLMPGAVAHLCRLVSFGNARLLPGADDEVIHRHASLRGEIEFRFVEPDPRVPGATHETLIATSVDEWLHLLGNRGCSGLELSYLATGDAWQVRARCGNRVEVWWSRWTAQATPLDAGGRRPPKLSVAFFGALSDEPEPRVLALSEWTARLDGALHEASLFARDHEASRRFARWFDDARELLRSEDPEAGIPEPVLTASAHSVAARRLFAAAERAWVFGATGSWSDLQFEDENVARTYRRLSGLLYDAIVRSAVAAVNTTEERPATRVPLSEASG
jgi:hypothetical protein